MEKFKEGEVVQHKISKEKMVIVRVLPKSFFRRQVEYLCSFGLEGRKVLEMRRSDYLRNYESELEKVK